MCMDISCRTTFYIPAISLAAIPVITYMPDPTIAPILMNVKSKVVKHLRNDVCRDVERDSIDFFLKDFHTNDDICLQNILN